MKKELLFITLIVLSISSNAQTTQTITIEWGFNSTPNASGAANTNRTIEVGDTVEWRWYDGGFHNVASTGGTESFNSGSTTNTNGVNFSFTFNQLGTTNFICQPHSSIMFGAITVVSEGTLGIDDLSLENFSLFPNPASTEISLKLPKALNLKTIAIHDLLGQEVFKTKTSVNTIDISNLNQGMFFLKITSEESSFSKRFIKL
ncbi:T9SS type A sorting domain-containing protein [Litoribaculum gwangyangense]|uniref:T9SS type A sorting domain-containing protein n=1 Tax=Litoribaculum gwangyangense TaxID=1130722 RepID=A0ABP9CT02_9FLAO